MDKKEYEEHNEIDYLKNVLQATNNILEDFAEEKKKLQELQKATINILEDFNEEKIRVLNYNENLKKEINDRLETENKLKSVNKELEGFSYSISHDLRAPLRAIQGYSRILFEQYSDKLDEEGIEYLKDILRNSENMGQLIDDILHFSRLSRKQMQTTNVDITKTVRNIISEIYFKNQKPNITFNVSELPYVIADPALIKQVLINLLSNAVKYSSKKENSVIEISGRVKENENIYCVKDNGVGFDMKYIDKLFGVFQRLHRHNEFEGTGVGLAIVKRIIEKHGGKVWADAVLNEGAAFYFSLPHVYSESE